MFQGWYLTCGLSCRSVSAANGTASCVIKPYVNANIQSESLLFCMVKNQPPNHTSPPRFSGASKSLAPLPFSLCPLQATSPWPFTPWPPPSATSRPMLSLWLSPFLLLSLPSLWGQGLSSCPQSCLPGRRVASLWDKENTRRPPPSPVPHQLGPSLRWNFDRLWRASGIPLCQAQCAGISLWTAGSATNWAAVTSSLRLNGRWNWSRPTRQYITQLWGVYGAIYFKLSEMWFWEDRAAVQVMEEVWLPLED